MSLHKILVLSAFLAVSACGFQPMYGDNSAAKVASDDLEKVRIAGIILRENEIASGTRIGDRLRQSMTNELIDLMYKNGYPKDPAYDLLIEIESTERETGIQKDATATRAELLMTAEMVLRTTKGQQELYRTTARTRVAYNILDGQYGTLVAKENAYDRALDTLAADIVTRISLYLNRDDKE